MAEDLLSGRRQHDLPIPLREKAGSIVLFKFLDLLAHRGTGRDVDEWRRGGKGACLYDRKERADVPNLQSDLREITKYLVGVADGRGYLGLGVAKRANNLGWNELSTLDGPGP